MTLRECFDHGPELPLPDFEFRADVEDGLELPLPSDRWRLAWRELRSLFGEHLGGPVDAVCCWLVGALDRLACWGRGPRCPGCRGRSNWGRWL